MPWGDDVAELEPVAPVAAVATSSATFVLCAVLAIFRGDFELARWAAREAALARAKEAWEVS